MDNRRRAAAAAAGRVVMVPGYGYRVYRDRGARDEDWMEDGALSSAEAAELVALGASSIAA